MYSTSLAWKNLILLNDTGGVGIRDLPDSTQDYFRKLSGYDTLRLVLAKSAILVEGPSDELIIQRAYRDTHDGKLPIEDGIDVMNVRGLAFSRFLDISKLLKKKTTVVRDNNGEDAAHLNARYADYTSENYITVHLISEARSLVHMTNSYPYSATERNENCLSNLLQTKRMKTKAFLKHASLQIILMMLFCG